MLRRAVLLFVLVIASAPLTAASQQGDVVGDSFESLLHRGFELHQRNEYSAALPSLQKAWKLRPHDYFVNLLTGIDLLRTGKINECISYLREAAHQKPQEEFAYEYLGEAYTALQQHAEAFTYFKKSVDAVPDSSEAKTSFAGYCLARFADLSAQMRSSQPGLAAEYRLQALSRTRSDPSRVELLQRATALSDDVENWIQLALTQIAAGDIKAGGAALEHAKQLSPGDLGVAEAEALLEAEKGNWQMAANFLDTIASRSPAAWARMLPDWPETLKPADQGGVSAAVAAFLDCVGASCDAQKLAGRLPKPVQVSNESADELFRKQRWDSVVRLPLHINSPGEAWFEHGVAWAEIGQCEHAVPALERGMAVKENAARAMFHLSRCYAQQADEVAGQLAESGKNEALVHLLRGDVLLRLQANSKAAVVEYQAAVTAHPEDPAGWERLAEAQLASESTEAARLSAQQALKLDAHRLPAIGTLAQAAMQERNYAEALPFLRQLAIQNPRDLTVRVQLATADSQTGELEDALTNLDSALQQGYPDEKGSLHYQLGSILHRLGRTREANRAFAKAKELSDHFQNTSLRPKEQKE